MAQAEAPPAGCRQPAGGDVPSTYRQVLAVPEFRAVFAAQILATLGNVAVQVTLAVMVYERTRSPLLSALTFAAGFAPYLLGATLLSAVADRYPSRAVQVACQLASCGAAAVMTVPGLPIPALLALLLVPGAAAPVFQGARAASLPDILPGPGFALGRSLLRLVSQSAQIVGYAAGGLLLLALTPAQALLAAAGTFGCAALLLRAGSPYRPARAAAGARGSLARASLAGSVRVLAVPGLLPLLLLTWLPPVFAVAPEGLVTPYVSELHGGTAAVGLLLCAAPVGSVVGELLAGTALSPQARSRLVVPAAAVMFVPLLGFGASPGIWAAAGLLAACGVGFAYTLGLDQRVLDATPEALRGQVFTLTTAGLMVGQGIGFAAAGAIAEILPVHLVIAGAGILGLASLALSRTPGHRRGESAAPN